MGLASSQARMLLLTARKSDLEYRAQMISQRKINLAMQTQQLATNYSQSMSNRVMKLNYANVDGVAQYETLSYYGITAENPDYVGDYIVKTANGKYAATDINDALSVAVKVINSEGGIPSTQSVTRYYAPADADGNSKELTYENMAAQNYLFTTKDAEGNSVYLAKNEADQTTIAKNLAIAEGKDFDKLDEKEQKAYLAKVVIDRNEALSSSSSIYNALKEGKVSLVQLNEDKNAYKEAKIDLNDCQKSTRTEKVGQKLDASSLSKDQKEAVLEYFEQHFGGFAYISAMDNANYFQDALRNGALFLFKNEQTTKIDESGNRVDVESGYKSVSWSSVGPIADSLNTADDAEAEAEYEAKSLVLSNQDKMLDLELNQIQTQHTAIETEYDSVKKVIQKNIEVSYKIFA